MQNHAAARAAVQIVEAFGFEVLITTNGVVEVGVPTINYDVVGSKVRNQGFDAIIHGFAGRYHEPHHLASFQLLAHFAQTVGGGNAFQKDIFDIFGDYIVSHNLIAMTM